MYPRAVKIRFSSGSVHEYIRIVEAYRENGKVRQRVVADLVRQDLLVEILPKLSPLLAGETDLECDHPAAPQVADASTCGANRQRIANSGRSFFRHRITSLNVGQSRQIQRRLVAAPAGAARRKSVPGEWRRRAVIERRSADFPADEVSGPVACPDPVPRTGEPRQ